MARYNVKAGGSATSSGAGRKWDIYLGDELIEGGFFHRQVALAACDEWNRRSADSDYVVCGYCGQGHRSHECERQPS